MTDELLIERYQAGASLRAIAAEIGSTPDTVSVKLKRLGVTLRRSGRPATSDSQQICITISRRALATLDVLAQQWGGSRSRAVEAVLGCGK